MTVISTFSPPTFFTKSDNGTILTATPILSVLSASVAQEAVEAVRVTISTNNKTVEIDLVNLFGPITSSLEKVDLT